MKKKYILLFFLFAFIKPYNSQVNLSVYSEVSLITAGPGTELFEAFGHSAIRIKDPVLQIDLIYNYGMFDFNAPNFYSNFTKGKLLYSLGRYNFEYFLESYKKDKRWVKQQVLNLTLQEKQTFFKYLENNALPENATYLYDPYFNNCATKLRDITISILGNKVVFIDENIDKNQSFRQLMNKEIHWNTWGNFGINLALGSKLDQKATSDQYMYLPKYVYAIFKNSQLFIRNQPENIILREDVLLDFEEQKQELSIFNPFLIFSILSFVGIFITISDYKKEKRSKWLDFTILFTTGVAGVLIIFLWFFTDHSTAPNNFNFLWAFAPNLIIAFLMLKNNQQKWMKFYFIFSLVLLINIPILWISEVQLFPVAVIPVLMLLFFRYLFLSKALK
ncbi:lipoprotein N-acyltransferase Lnb domain-containing protein [Polaribacter glomeratus]|uniref:Uncharacterized protein n=1 Tax=Polaribacter glomeratus TaxID=102 RepID=A0A2S7WWH9_9FLAO|nr:DUF4105 domain-containing protein [Polaribacter glomeratus]PQJ81622.1 hypothetical protein BTO16_03140 [Polaribacter glomeratus]TXD66453.1 DUF4105 domain-containing protein [Polaribacter glomeratus]